MRKLLSSENGITGSKGTEESSSIHDKSLVVFSRGMQLLAMNSTPYVPGGYAVSSSFNHCSLSY